MPNPISLWTRLAAADLVNTADLIPVIDVSAGSSGSKNMTPADLMQSAPGVTHCIVGYNAARSITSGTYVHAFGYNALYALTTGLQCTAVGRQAGAAVTTGNANTLVGALAGRQITTGGGNTVVGADALQGATPGSYNVAVGNMAQYTGASGQTENTAVGALALYSDTANDNTAVGHAALYSKAAGANNVAVGQNAGRFIADGSTPVTATANSVYVGRNARGGSATGDSNTIVIGYLAAGLGANTTAIGSSSTLVAALYGAHQLNNVVAPSGVTDACHIYSADQAPGNACPHIRTEHGETIKLYQGAAVANPGAGEAEAKLIELLTILRAQGLIAT